MPRAQSTSITVRRPQVSPRGQSRPAWTWKTQILDEPGSGGVSSCIDRCYVNLTNIKAFSAFVLPKQRLYMMENGCHDRSSTDLVSHSFSLLSCFGVTRCFYVEWLMLTLKGLGWISLCVHVCVYVHFVCVRTRMLYATYQQAGAWLAYMKMSQFHGLQRPRSPTHTSSRAMQMVWFVNVHKSYCVP